MEIINLFTLGNNAPPKEKQEILIATLMSKTEATAQEAELILISFHWKLELAEQYYHDLMLAQQGVIIPPLGEPNLIKGAKNAGNS